MTTVRVAVIGCGAVAEIYHLPALARSSRGHLAAVVDADAGRAEEVGRRFGATMRVGGYTELPGRVDAAIVATPNATHAEIASTLLASGVHVLCEKPMATTRRDAERMLAAAERGRARLMAAQCRRFSPNLQALKDLLAAERLGRIERVVAALGGRYGRWPQRTDFRRQRALAGGGVLLDLGIHLIDLVVSLTGGGVSLAEYRAEDALGWGVESDVDVSLRLGAGGEAHLSCSYSHDLGRTLEVTGSDGWARTSVDPAPDLAVFSSTMRVCTRAGVQQLVLPVEDPYVLQLEHFLTCLQTGAPFQVRDDEVLACLGLTDQCYETAQAA